MCHEIHEPAITILVYKRHQISTCRDIDTIMLTLIAECNLNRTTAVLQLLIHIALEAYPVSGI